MFERNLKYLNDNRILYRRDPVDDIPTKQYNWGWYYEHGTFECYALFRSKAKITTYKSLKWHLIVLYYLNQEMTHLQFNTLARFVANKSNGYVTFNCPTDIIDKMINEVSLIDFDNDRPKNKARKVIFRDNPGSNTKQKQQIIGKLIGRQKKAQPEDIYEAMLTINDNKKKITIKKIATILNVSTRTIYRNITNGLVREKKLLNEEI
jgi:Fic family protein